MPELLPEEQAAVDDFIGDVKAKVEKFESAKVFTVRSREDFESVLKQLPDAIYVIAAWDPLDE